MRNFLWIMGLILAASPCLASELCSDDMLARPVAPVWEPKDEDRHLGQVAEELWSQDAKVDPTAAGLQVYLFQSEDTTTPLFKEIGRQREHVFRSVGEGSGLSLDLDRYDSLFHHLVAFDSKNRRLVGAYRMGRLDLLHQIGESGYTNDEFEYSKALTQALNTKGLEFGRSFVDKTAGKSAAIAFFKIWQRIGAFMADHPDYRYLIGPVSMSNTYSPKAIRIMIEFLKQNYAPENPAMSATARPRYHYDDPATSDEKAFVRGLKSLDDLNEVIRSMEGKDIPPLLGIYATLGARYLAFAFDAEFNTVDGMILIDLHKMKHDPELRAHVTKFLTPSGVETYLKANQ